MRSASGAAASTASSPRARDPRARRAAPRVAVTARAVTRADAPRAPSPAPENADQNTLLATAAVVGVASGLAVSAFAATEKAINVVASASCASVGLRQSGTTLPGPDTQTLRHSKVTGMTQTLRQQDARTLVTMAPLP